MPVTPSFKLDLFLEHEGTEPLNSLMQRQAYYWKTQWGLSRIVRKSN